MLHVCKFCKSIFRGRPSRNIHRIVLGVRNKSRRETLPHTHQQSVHGRVEMDSHADTTVLGSNCVVLAYTGKECEVSPYADEYDAIRNVPVVTGVTVWTTLRMVCQFSLYSTKPSGWETNYITRSSTQTNYGPTG